jgi:opacity protein-like surface antigen
MVGSRFTIPSLAIAAALAAMSAAHAADLPQPVIIPQPVFSGWYLRGDIGFSNQDVDNLTNVNDVDNVVVDVGDGFDAAPIYGLGVGYYFNDWLRFDVTGEYRAKANFHGTQVITSACCGTITDEYSGSKSEWLFLANGYLDLGTWSGFTPFVGAGVGFSRNTISSFQDVCTVCAGGGVAFAEDQSKWNFAWALHAGVSYRVSPNFAIEFAYRYVDLGDAESGDIYTYLGTNNINNPMEFNHITSHDFRLGLRVNLDAFDAYGPPPPVYAPAPVYTPPPPPLRSRG